MSISVTVSEWPFATATSPPSGRSATPDGALPTGTSFRSPVPTCSTVRLPGNTDPFSSTGISTPPLGAVRAPAGVSDPARFVTYATSPRTATPNGARPVFQRRVSFRAAVSNSTRTFSRCIATYARAPSAENAIPVGTGCPASGIRTVPLTFPFAPISAISRLSGPERVASDAHKYFPSGENASPAYDVVFASTRSTTLPLAASKINTSRPLSTANHRLVGSNARSTGRPLKNV